MRLDDELDRFATANRLIGRGPGPLCVALVVTRYAKTQGLPLNPEALLTDRGGQVRGLGKAAVQAILRDYGITRVLAEEGARTSRGSIENMRTYVELLNKLQSRGMVDLAAAEAWWIDRVRDFFDAKPFVLRFDPSKSLRAIVSDLLGQALKRQAEAGGTMFAGTVMQHLVGAKLELVLGEPIEHHGASVADGPSGRDGDFVVGDVALHVTAAPGEAVIRKCERNLEKGLRPVIVTMHARVPTASGLADQSGVGDRIDVFDAEQFLAGNLYELGRFVHQGRRASADQLIKKYNEIVEAQERDPSLRVTIGE